jgi:hypothetical protein
MRWATLLAAPALVAATAALAGCGDDTADTHASSGSTAPTSGSTMAGSQVRHVDVPGSDRPVVLTREDHPRGGYQLHLYVELPGGPHELTDVHHNPVIPFVATDTRPGTPVSADCTKDGFAVTEAQPTKPAGVMFAWDVHRTSYSVSGDQAVPLREVTLATSVPDEQLRRDMPELFSRSMFTHC